jgi:hypothetical protein
MRKVVIASLQLLAALVCAGAFIALAFSKIDPAKVWRVWFTAILYGYLCYLTRSLWQRKLYWLLLAGCVAAHVAILVAVQRTYPHIPLPYYVLFGSIEAGGVYLLLLAVTG